MYWGRNASGMIEERRKTGVSGEEWTKGRIVGDYTRRKHTHCKVPVDSREYPHLLFVIECFMCLFCVLSFSPFSCLFFTQQSFSFFFLKNICHFDYPESHFSFSKAARWFFFFAGKMASSPLLVLIKVLYVSLIYVSAQPITPLSLELASSPRWRMIEASATWQ